MNTERGFSLIELLVVILIIGPLFGLIATSSTVATRTLNANDAVAATTEGLQRTVQRLTHFVRPCVLSTYKVEATADDVAALRATAVGEWIAPLDGEPRTVIRFQSADGNLSMNASSLTQPRTIRFVMDAGETRNGSDDDGDGFVDEGRIVLDYDGVRADMVITAEQCALTVVGREFTMTLTAVSRSRDGRLIRTTTSHVLNLRNN